MELDVYLKQRFDRLRNVIQRRDQKIRDMEHQVIRFFENGNLQEIENLMNQKKKMLLTNRELSLFIKKWESKVEERDQSLYTSI